MELDLDMEVLVTLFFILLKLLRSLVTPIFALIYRRKQNKLPVIGHEFLELPAVELAERIRTRKITATNVVRLFIDRIREVNSYINAVADERYDEALRDAIKVDEIIVNSSPEYLKENYPLLGVPFSTKESLAVGGLKNIIESGNSESVRLLRAAGAIPICVTNVSEWIISFDQKSLKKRTSNPYDQSRSAGGSSGGQAALVGAGGSAFGVASDITGGIRVPALFCGIFGHKPTLSVVCCDGHSPNLCETTYGGCGVVGPLTRYATDLKELLNIMSNKDPRLHLNEPVSIEKIRIYYKLEFNDVSFEVVGVSKSIKASMSKAVEHFRINGNFVAETQIDLSHCVNIGCVHFMDVDLPSLVKIKDKNRDVLCKELGKSLIGQSQYSTFALILNLFSELKILASKEKIARYKDELEYIRQEFMKILGEDGVFFFPTFSTPAFYHYESLPMWSGLAYAQIFSLLGFPSTHCPLGLNSNGLPVGFQVVAAPFQDRLCLAVACELERSFGGWVHPTENYVPEIQVVPYQLQMQRLG